MKFEILIFIFCIIIQLVRSEVIEVAPNADEGREVFYTSLRTLIYGSKENKPYKDLFVDTSKSILDQLEQAAGSIHIPIEDLLRIFVQTIIIMIANNRADLIPSDFNGRSKALN